MLGHNVLDAVLVVIQMCVDILCLHRSEVFKPLKQVRLIFAPHQVDLLGCQVTGKLPVIRESPAFPLGPQGIDELVHIVVCGIVVAQDLLVQRQEYFIEGIGRDLTDISAEQIVLRDFKDLTYRLR